MNASTVNTTNIVVRGQQSGAIAGTWSVTNAVATFNPTADLEAGEVIHVEISTSVQSSGGAPATKKALSFTVSPSASKAGSAWTAAAASELTTWHSVTYANGRFVAVAYEGTNRVMYSTDGVTWTAAAASEANQWRSLTYGNGRFVAVAIDGTNRVMYSADGAAWTAAAASAANAWYSVTYGNGRFVAVAYTGTNRVMYSDDGATWTAVASSENNTWQSVTYGNGRFVAVAVDGTNRVMYSADGATWTAAPAAEAKDWLSVTYGNGRFIAVAYGSNQVMYSVDGATWTAAAAPVASWRSVTYGNGRFVAVAENGTNRVMYSDDGATWTAAAASAANAWRSVTYGNGRFVAVAENGTNRVMVSYLPNTVGISSARGFRLIASPVTTTYADVLAEGWTQGATGADVTNGSPNVWTWNNSSATNSSSNWTAVTDLTVNATGTNAFLYYHYDDKDFNGRDNASATFSVAGTEKAAPGAVSLNSNADGWTFVGNPFASSIGWDLVTSKTNIQTDARIWNPTADNTGNWATISGSGKIAMMQGFFVQTTANGAASMTIEAGSKTTAGTFYGKTAADELAELVFQFKSGSMFSEPRARIHAEASFGRDRFDGDRMAPLAANYVDAYFTDSDGRAHSNNAVPVLEEAFEMPLHFEMTQSGRVTITVTRNTFPAGVKAELLDIKTGANVEITGDFSYEFDHIKAGKIRSLDDVLRSPTTMAASTDDVRFKLILTPPATTSTEDANTVTRFALDQNYPNPFNPTTVFSFQLPVDGRTSLKVYDVVGREVAVVIEDMMSAGTHTVSFDASELSSGVYIYRLQTAQGVLTRKMVLIK